MYKTFDQQYIDMATKIIYQGSSVTGRDNLRYKQIFGQDILVDLRKEFPILTLRRMPIKNLLREFLWDLHGKSDIPSLGKAKHFWDFLATPDGYLPHSYGSSWRSWPVNASQTEAELVHQPYKQERYDQLKYIYEQLQTNPTNRQLVLQTYNPAYRLDIAKCPPCHPSIVFSSDGYYLDCLILGRSWDLGTGTPLDTFRYALLMTIMAKDAPLVPRYLKISSANTHIYEKNIKSIKEIINKTPVESSKPRVIIHKPLFELKDIEDIEVLDYQSHPNVRIEVAA